MTKQERLKLLRERVAALRRRRYADETPTTPRRGRQHPTEQQRLVVIDAYLARLENGERPAWVCGYNFGTIQRWMTARGLYVRDVKRRSLKISHRHDVLVLGCPQCIAEARVAS